MGVLQHPFGVLHHICDSKVYLKHRAMCTQGALASVEGISLQGLQAGSVGFEALSRMPELRILILDGVRTDQCAVRLPNTTLGHAVMARRWRMFAAFCFGDGQIGCGAGCFGK